MNQVIFDGVASYSDWGLFCTSVNVEEPEPKELYIDIPFRDGSIDLTESLTGDIAYKDRKFEASFAFIGNEKEWEPLKRKVRAHLHGKRRVIETDNLKEYYLDGRCQTTFERDGVVLRLTVAATCDTYMIKKIPTIYNVTIDSAGTKSIVCKNSRKRVIPTITTDGEITITFNGNSYTLDAGTHRITNIVFTEGDNNITFSGAEGTKLSVEYREGAI